MSKDPREPKERDTAEIRAVVPEDLDRLLPLVAAFFQEEGIETSPEAQRENLLAMMAAPGTRILLAQAGEQALGFASATLTRGIEFGLAAEIEDLYLVPEARGQGLARRLMAELIAWCEGEGAQEIIVVMTPEGMEAVDLPGFYRRFGFKDSDRTLLYRSSGSAG